MRMCTPHMWPFEAIDIDKRMPCHTGHERRTRPPPASRLPLHATRSSVRPHKPSWLNISLLSLPGSVRVLAGRRLRPDSARLPRYVPCGCDLERCARGDLIRDGKLVSDSPARSLLATYTHTHTSNVLSISRWHCINVLNPGSRLHPSCLVTVLVFLIPLFCLSVHGWGPEKPTIGHMLAPK